MSSDKKKLKTLDKILDDLKLAEKEYQDKLNKYADFLAECEKKYSNK